VTIAGPGRPGPATSGLGGRLPPNGLFLLGAGAVLIVALLLLSVGIGDDYRLQHEDNNALWTLFAHSHLRLGLGATRGQDAFVLRSTGAVTFYAHHPPGPGLATAAALSLAGSDEPRVVRSTAIFFQLVSIGLFLRLVRRVSGDRVSLAAGLLVAVLPMGAFYGRMVNHETLALPAWILLVDQTLRYLDTARGRNLAGLVVSIVWGALVGWVSFFGAFAVFLWLVLRGRSVAPDRWRAAALWIGASASLAFVLVLCHLLWASGGGWGELQRIFLERIGVGKDYGAVAWLGKMLSFARRLFTATGTVALGWVIWRLGRSMARGRRERSAQPADVVLISALTGLSYMLVFNWGAWQHHYWQFPLLPGVALALALLLRRLLAWAGEDPSGRIRRRAVVVLVLLEICLTSGISLYARHTKASRYCLETVSRLRAEYF